MSIHYHVTIHPSVPLQPITINGETVNRHIFEFTCEDFHSTDAVVHFHNASIGTPEAPWVCDFLYVVPVGHSVTYTAHEENDGSETDSLVDTADHAEVPAGDEVHA